MRPEDFPAVFAEGWALPKPGPFLDYFRPLIHDQATFTQPMFTSACGPGDIERMFRRLFALFPDLHADPQRSAVHGGIVFIESNCTATLGRKPIHFPVGDRFVIDNGKILDRRSYSDPTSVLLTVLRRPTSWPRGLRSHISGGNSRPPLP